AVQSARGAGAHGPAATHGAGGSHGAAHDAGAGHSGHAGHAGDTTASDNAAARTAPSHPNHYHVPMESGHAAGHDATSSQAATTGSHALIHLKRRSLLAAVLSLLSPMTIALFLSFFGLIGLLLMELAPLLGIVSLPIAAVVSCLL